jgi:uncharacterized protein DUF222
MISAVIDHPSGVDISAFPLTAAEAYQRVAAQAEAAQLLSIAHHIAAHPGEELLYVEIAAKLRISPTYAKARMALAITLTTRLPATMAAFRAGRIDRYRAEKIVDATDNLTLDEAHQVEELVMDVAETRTAHQLTYALKKAVLSVNREAAEQRRQEQVRTRRVDHYPVDDGGGVLAIHGPIERTHIAHARIDAIARNLKAAGAADGRTMDQLRADVALDLLAGKTFDHAKIHVWLTLPATTALGVDDKPGYLAGYGDITAQHALELAGQQDATWQRVLTEPTTGQVLDVGRHRYQPPAALKDHTLANIPTCTGPGCTRPAHLCDIDHAEPFPTGPTSEDNLHPACRTHHNAKTHGNWTISKTRSEITWISPRGFRFVRKPEPIAEPEPEPPS